MSDPIVRKKVLDHWKSYAKSPDATLDELREYKKLLKHLANMASVEDRVEMLVAALNRIKWGSRDYWKSVKRAFKSQGFPLAFDLDIQAGAWNFTSEKDGYMFSLIFDGPGNWQTKDRTESNVIQLADWKRRAERPSAVSRPA